MPPRQASAGLRTAAVCNPHAAPAPSSPHFRVAEKPRLRTARSLWTPGQTGVPREHARAGAERRRGGGAHSCSGTERTAAGARTLGGRGHL